MAGAGLAVAAGVLAGSFLAASPARALEFDERAAAGVASIESFHSPQLTVHSLADSPGVYILDFPGLEQQGRMFARVLALIERTGGDRERVLSDAELDKLIKASGKGMASYAYGNDFRVSELVKFFNMAGDERVALNPDEEGLRDFLLAKGAMVRKFEFYSAVEPERVVISIPQSGGDKAAGPIAITPSLRRAILRHEISHGEYYTNDGYAGYCRGFWQQAMTERQRAAFRKFLVAKGYDPANEELMINETQAYLIHTPSAAIFSPGRVGLSGTEVAALVKRFWAGDPPSRLFQREHPRSH